MTINELLALNNLTANDQIPVWNAEATGSTEPTAKITAQNFANAVKSLANLIGIGDLDATPTQGSTRAVQSGGVFDAIAQSTAVESINPYSGVRVYKSGNVAEISFEGFSAQQDYSANEALFTLPEGYRPKYSLSFLDSLNSGKRIAVESTGKVYVTSALSLGNLLRGCAAYIC